MKIAIKLLALVGILTTATAALAESTYLDDAGSIQATSPTQDRNSVGAALIYNQNIYSGVGNRIVLFPLFNLSMDNFFLKGTTFGYNMYQDESWTFSLIAGPQFGGYNADDSDELSGMSDTSYLVNAGVQAQYRLMPFVLTMAALHDMTGRTAGNSASAKLAAMVPLDDKRLALIPSISLTWEDSDITDYYYGVTNSEATATRPAYEPGTAVNVGYGLSLKYRLSEHWGATLGYVLTQYADDISDSPIVSRSYASTYLAGMSYIF